MKAFSDSKASHIKYVFDKGYFYLFKFAFYFYLNALTVHSFRNGTSQPFPYHHFSEEGRSIWKELGLNPGPLAPQETTLTIESSHIIVILISFSSYFRVLLKRHRIT